jgi:hypothetical protein
MKASTRVTIASDFPLHPLSWSRATQLANQIWFGIDTANRFMLLRRWGVERTEQLEFTFLRKHQETHFLDGLKKLELADEDPAVASARYHVLSNVLGGLDMGYREDDESRAWVFYFPPSPFGASSMQPGAGILCVPTPVILAGMRAWHANNGVLLGEPRLRFTVTDLLSEGGPFDAGYFDLAAEDVPEDERLRVRLGDPSPVPGPPPALGSVTWPQERRDAALQKYSAQYALGGLAQIATRSSLDEAAVIAEASVTALFTSWARPLVAEFGIDDPEPRERLARLMTEMFGLVGERLEREDGHGRILLRSVASRMAVPEYEGWETTPAPILDAFARSWSVVSRAIGDPLTVTAVAGDLPTWIIE